MKRKYDKIMEESHYNDIWKEEENESLVYLKTIPINWDLATNLPLGFEEEKNFKKYYHTIKFITFDQFIQNFKNSIDCDDIIHIIVCYISAHDELGKRIKNTNDATRECVCCLKKTKEMPAEFVGWSSNEVEINCERCTSWFCTPCWNGGYIPYARLRIVKYNKVKRSLSLSINSITYLSFLIVHYTQCPSCLSGSNHYPFED